MNSPVLVEVVRRLKVESEHRGRAAVVDADGGVVLALGDTARPVFPRSAVKPLQALPLVETGAADRLGFGDEELALASASHAGEPAHVAVVERMLGRAGLNVGALLCGVHWPSHQVSAQTLARVGRKPTALHHNCSGKHAGFLCVAGALSVDHANYPDPAHPVQRLVKAAIEGITGARLEDDAMAVDGCSVPTWSLPLVDLAHGFARFGTGRALLPDRAKAAARICRACATQPFHVAGTDRFCTKLMQHFGTRLLVKTGAEGVLCGALPQKGLGIAVKCDDGATRAAEVIMAVLIARLLALDDADHAVLEPFTRPVLRNWNGIEVGVLRPSEALLGAHRT